MKLCYKSYEVKMSLKAIKTFRQKTGKDLWALLLAFVAEYESKDARELPLLERMAQLYLVCDFETASQAFHCLITDDGVSLEEVQDAMFRVGWRPSDKEGDYAEPWPFVMTKVVYELDEQFQDIQSSAKKKADTSEQ